MEGNMDKAQQRTFGDLPKAQQEAILALRERMARWSFLDIELGEVSSESESKYEWKEFMFLHMDYGSPVVEVRATIGLKNDEGTQAEVFARTSWQIFVGPRGGLTAYGWDEKAKRTLRYNGSAAFHGGRRH
jgi:hypothetical protein